MSWPGEAPNVWIAVKESTEEYGIGLDGAPMPLFHIADRRTAELFAELLNQTTWLHERLGHVEHATSILVECGQCHKTIKMSDMLQHFVNEHDWHVVYGTAE